MLDQTSALLSNVLYFALCLFIVAALLLLLRSGPERAAWRRLTGSRSGRVSMLLLAIFLLVGLADSLNLPRLLGEAHGESLLDMSLRRFVTDQPANAHPLAAIMFEQSFKGVRTAWLVGAAGFVAWLPVTILAGVSAGLIGGIFGRMVVAACDVFDAIPGVLMLVMLAFVAQPLIVVLAQQFPALASPSELRLLALSMMLGLVRAPALCRRIQLRTAGFMVSDAVAAARCVGISRAQLMRRRLLPEILGMASIALATALPMLMMSEALLSYLGMGLDPVTRSLGTVLSDTLAIVATDPESVEVLVAALLPLGLMLMAAALFAFSVNAAFGAVRR